MNTLAPVVEPQPATAQRCPKGQSLLKKWAQRVQNATAENWQRIFFHKTRYGYDTHVKDCLECQAYKNRHKPKEQP